MVRKWFTTVSLLALLLSAWGGVFAASMCAHMSEGRACCPARAEHRAPSHEGMAGMSMNDARSDAATGRADSAGQGVEAEALTGPNESCSHCMSHSRTPASSTSLREAIRTERDEGLTLAPPASKSFDAVAIHFDPPDASDHAPPPPPASASARHVLLNVFRI